MSDFSQALEQELKDYGKSLADGASKGNEILQKRQRSNFFC